MRVASVRHITLDTPVPVYDIEVANVHNFKLHDSAYVHNSKDVADAVCGAYSTLIERRSSWVSSAQDDTPETDRWSGSDRMDAARFS